MWIESLQMEVHLQTPRHGSFYWIVYLAPLESISRRFPHYSNEPPKLGNRHCQTITTNNCYKLLFSRFIKMWRFCRHRSLPTNIYTLLYRIGNFAFKQRPLGGLEMHFNQKCDLFTLNHINSIERVSCDVNKMPHDVVRHRKWIDIYICFVRWFMHIWIVFVFAARYNVALKCLIKITKLN